MREQKKKKKEAITEHVKVRYLKISNPGWDSCTTFPS